MALYRSPELLWTVQKCSRASVSKILLRFDLVTYFWTQSHPLSRQTFWYGFIKIESKLWPLEGEQDFNSFWPSDPDFLSDMTYIWTWPRYHQDKNSDKISWKLKQIYGLKMVNMVLKQFDLLTQFLTQLDPYSTASLIKIRPKLWPLECSQAKSWRTTTDRDR